MKASDLRIGNFLRPAQKDQSQDEYYSVCELNTTQFICEDSAGLIFYNGRSEPIPITEEWLLKFGFKKGILGYSIDRPSFCISYESGSIFLCYGEYQDRHCR